MNDNDTQPSDILPNTSAPHSEHSLSAQESDTLKVNNEKIAPKSRKDNAKVDNKTEKPSTIEVYSLRLRDGRIAEAYYDRIKEETGLLVFQDSKVTKERQITVGHTAYTAPPPTNSLIKSGFIKLPSDALPFGSEASLMREVKSLIHDYVQVSPDFEDISSYYIPLTWVFDNFQELAYLRVIGDYGSGKSRYLKVMAGICYRPTNLNGAASSSAMFRIIDEVKGTIIFDEADFRSSDASSEMVKILNNGFHTGMPVLRSEASGKNMKSYNPTAFDVFGPKIIATRMNFTDDALESRCCTHAMEVLTRDDIPESLENDFEERALRIRNMLVMFRFLKLSGGISSDSLPKLDIEARLRQIFSPLYRIITDPAEREKILNFIKNKQAEVTERRYSSFEGELLQAILNVLETEPEPTMKEIAIDYDAKFGGKFPIEPRKVGSTIDQIFHLEKKRAADGFHLCSNTTNKKKIIALKIKFGIDMPQMNVVNDMNVSPDVSGLNSEQVMDLFGGGEIAPD